MMVLVGHCIMMVSLALALVICFWSSFAVQLVTVIVAANDIVGIDMIATTHKRENKKIRMRREEKIKTDGD
jgi:hypothetical protein